MALENPLWLQNLTYLARLDRRLLAVLFSEGVLDVRGGALKVTQRAAGANMSVDIAPGVGFVAGDDQADQGRYLIPSTAVENRTITAAPAAGARIDTVIARVRDANVTGAFNDWLLEVVVGAVSTANPPTPAAPAVSNTAMPLADVRVDAGVASIVDAKITDRRAQATMANAEPPGTIKIHNTAYAPIPAGWQACDGTNGTPDLRGRFIVGAGGAYAEGATGGADSVTLTTAQIPSHSHSHSHGETLHRGDEGTGSYVVNPVAARTGSASGGFSQTNTDTNATAAGGGGSHENRPAFKAVVFIMKL